MRQKWMVSLLLLGLVCTLFGCTETPDSLERIDSNAQSKLDLTDVMLTRSNSDLDLDVVLDVSSSGRGLLCQKQEQYEIVTIDETATSVAEIPCAFPTDFTPQQIDERAGDYLVAGRNGQDIAIYRVMENGDVTFAASTPAEQSVLDLAQMECGDFCLILGTIVEVAQFDTSYVEQTSILRFDSQGNVTSIPMETPAETLFALHQEADGTILAFSNQSTTEEQQVCVYAVQEHQLSLVDTLPIKQATSLSAGTPEALYLSTESELYQYEPASQSITRIAKWANYSVNGNTVRGGSVLSSECILLWSRDQLWRLQPRDPNQNTITLRVAVIEPFELPIEELLDFQASYPEYQVETVSFQDQEELNLALAAGEPLDLIQVDEMDATRYIYNGVFLDLTSYLKNDATLALEDFHSKLWEMTRVEDKLPILMTNFSIQGLYGPKALLGDKTALSLDEFQELTADSRFFETTVCENAITWLCSVAGFAADGSISQDDQDNLAQLIALATKFQHSFETVDYNIPGDELPLNWLNGSNSLAIRQLEEQGMRLWNTEELSFLGYPSAEGIAFCQSRSYGICTTSEYPDAAWALIRYLLLAGNEDVGISMLRHGDLPLLDRLVAQINNQALNYASPILAIIQEESAMCFSGDRQPEDVVPVIANRVSIYLAEQLP